MMTQTKFGSFIEAWANIGVGFSINWCANMLILPLFGFAVTGSQALSAPSRHPAQQLRPLTVVGGDAGKCGSGKLTLPGSH